MPLTCALVPTRMKDSAQDVIKIASALRMGNAAFPARVTAIRDIGVPTAATLALVEWAMTLALATGSAHKEMAVAAVRVGTVDNYAMWRAHLIWHQHRTVRGKEPASFARL